MWGHEARETSHDLLTGMLSNTYMAETIQTNIKPDSQALHYGSLNIIEIICCYRT